MKRVIFLSAITLLTLATAMSCDKEDKEDKIALPIVKITKTFPLMLNNPSYKNGGIIVINSQQKLENVYQDSYLPKDLTNVDFNKNTVIVGSYGTTQGVDKVEHNFFKVGSKYEYILTIVLNDACVPEGVGFGIVVEKIPDNTEVMFKVNVIGN